MSEHTALETSDPRKLFSFQNYVDKYIHKKDQGYSRWRPTVRRWQIWTQQAVASKTDGMVYLHQIGILVQYLKTCPRRKCDCFHFQKTAICVTPLCVPERKPMHQHLHAYWQTEIFTFIHNVAVQSYINNWNEIIQEFAYWVADVISFHITKLPWGCMRRVISLACTLNGCCLMNWRII